MRHERTVSAHTWPVASTACWSILGSTNLDFQSLRYNDEGNVGILDPEFGVSMTRLFDEDLTRSTKIELAQ